MTFENVIGVLRKPIKFSSITNWLFNRKVGFREDGTIRSCGRECYINGQWNKICTKYLTGMTGTSTTTLVPHGINKTDILSVECAIDDGIKFCKSEYNLVPSTSNGFNYGWDNTHIIIDNIGNIFKGKDYKIKIEYKNGS